MRLTLGTLKPTIARILGMCTTNPKVTEYINEAQIRLLSRGHWVGCVQRYRVCVTDGCLTWPRQIEAIEAFAVCDNPGIVRNIWFEYVGNGPGLVSTDTSIGYTLVDRGEACTFEDMTGYTHNIRVQAELAEAAGLYIVLQGYDENNLWIQTNDSGTIIDGEKVLVSTVVQTSAKIFKKLVRVIKPVTVGRVNLYDYDPGTGIAIKIAAYDPDETLPTYRRSIIPNLANMENCETCDGEATTNKAITVVAKLRHIPVSVDNDFLILGNLPAFKDMIMSIKKREENLFQEAEAYEASAIKELQKELESYMGSGTVPAWRVQDRNTWGAGGVLNLI